MVLKKLRQQIHSKKNEINFAYIKYDTSSIAYYPDKSKVYGTEYIIWDLNQICPFIAIKLKRKKYCVIWRDNNFSFKPVALFKKILKKD